MEIIATVEVHHALIAGGAPIRRLAEEGDVARLGVRVVAVAPDEVREPAAVGVARVDAGRVAIHRRRAVERVERRVRMCVARRHADEEMLREMIVRANDHRLGVVVEVWHIRLRETLREDHVAAQENIPRMVIGSGDRCAPRLDLLHVDAAEHRAGHIGQRPDRILPRQHAAVDHLQAGIDIRVVHHESAAVELALAAGESARRVIAQALQIDVHVLRHESLVVEGRRAGERMELRR